MACRWVRPSGGFLVSLFWVRPHLDIKPSPKKRRSTRRCTLILSCFFLFIKAHNISNSIEVMGSPRPQSDRAEVDPLQIFKISLPSFFSLIIFPSSPWVRGPVSMIDIVLAMSFQTHCRDTRPSPAPRTPSFPWQSTKSTSTELSPSHQRDSLAPLLSPRFVPTPQSWGYQIPQ